MRRTTKLLLGGALGAVLVTAAAPAAWAMAEDELVCVDISTTEVGCCIVGDDGTAKKCFKVAV